jgi:glycerol-3-phosphate cytidylyltransferase
MHAYDLPACGGGRMIYCFDIDGTICTLTHNSNYHKAAPFEDVIERINELYDTGNRILMMTARGSVSKVDHTVLTQEQLKNWGVKYHELIMHKKPNADLYIDDKGINIKDWRKTKIKGLVAGCFDLIHPGYIQMFKDAKDICNHLVVALHENPSTERSEKFKPIHSVEEREIILRGIRYVDEIVRYKTEEDLEKLLVDTKPDYRIVGTDYLEKEFTGKHTEGVKIYYHSREHDWSYSALRRKLCNMII